MATVEATREQAAGTERSQHRGGPEWACDPRRIIADAPRQGPLLQAAPEGFWTAADGTRHQVFGFANRSAAALAVRYEAEAAFGFDTGVEPGSFIAAPGVVSHFAVPTAAGDEIGRVRLFCGLGEAQQEIVVDLAPAERLRVELFGCDDAAPCFATAA